MLEQSLCNHHFYKSGCCYFICDDGWRVNYVVNVRNVHSSGALHGNEEWYMYTRPSSFKMGLIRIQKWWTRNLTRPYCFHLFNQKWYFLIKLSLCNMRQKNNNNSNNNNSYSTTQEINFAISSASPFHFSTYSSRIS